MTLATEKETTPFSIFVNAVTSELCRVAPMDLADWFVIPADANNWRKERIHHQIGVINDNGVERKVFIEIWFRDPYNNKQEALLSSEIEYVDGQKRLSLVNFLDWKYKQGKHSISFSTNRTPEAIAKDIARKLIDEYNIGAYREAIAELRNNIDTARRTTEYLTPIAERLGLMVRRSDYHGIQLPTGIEWTHSIEMTTKIERIEPYSGCTEFEVKFKRLNREELEQLIQFFEGLAAHEEIMDSE
jgi:hypothetical protein